jgi:site-specific DNA recombinase
MNPQTNVPIKYFLYARKSSEAEDRQAASIDAQKDELLKIAKEQGLIILEVLEESQSAKKPGRKVFNSMLERIYKGEANGILCWKLDRLARNPVDGGQISWMLQQSAIAQIVTFGRTYYPTDNVLMMQVELGMANQFIRDLSVNVKRGLQKKVRDGWMPSGAPIGYLNTPNKQKGYKTLETDPDRFPLVRRLFDLALTGNYSIAQIWNMSRKQLNLRTVPRKSIGGKHLSRTAVYMILSNPFYYGWFEYPFKSGNWQKGAHEAMVTKDEFDRVQKVMGRTSQPRPREERLFAFTGMMKCATCGCSITAQAKTKYQKNGNIHHYIYYNCTKKKYDFGCTEKHVEVKLLHLQIGAILKDIKISEEYRDWAVRHVHEVRKNEAVSDSLAIKSKHKECEEVTLQLQSLTLNFTSPANKDRTVIGDSEYQALKSDLLKRKTMLEDDLKVKNKAVEQWAELSEATFDFACYAHLWYENGDEKTRRAILACLGSNLTISDKKLNVSYTSFFLSLIKAREAIEQEIELARTSQKPSLAKQNRHDVPVLSLRLRMLDKFRTVNWKELYREMGFLSVAIPRIQVPTSELA